MLDKKWKGTPSIRLQYVAVLICVSDTENGRVCGTLDRYEANEPELALDKARQNGWEFRKGAARCPDCGRKGRSFGKWLPT